MEKGYDELKAALMQDAEAEIDGMLKWDAAMGRVLTIQEMEDRLLEIRQRLGERLMERLLDYQTSKDASAAPRSEVDGKRLHNKGKKQSHRDAVGAGELPSDLLLRRRTARGL